SIQSIELQQRSRMNADHAIDDELQARQTYAAVGDAGEVERPIGITDVHHDFHGNLRERVQLDLFALEFQQPLIDVTRVAFGAGHRDFLALADRLRRIATTHYRRYSQLARDDGR